MLINPGEYRHSITIQAPPTSQGTYGEQSDIYTDVLTTRAAITPIVGREFFAAETVNSEITHKVRIRYRSGISPDMRILFGMRIFFISSVLDYKEQRKELQLMCRELV